MKVLPTERGYLITLSRGEKVREALTALCKKEGIFSGVFHAIGAVEDAEIGYYDLSTRSYFFKTFREAMEVASMIGNVAEVDGAPFLHIHAALSKMDESLACVGAHIAEATVAVTLEVFLTPFSVPVKRVYDEETGLKLLSLKP